jgi:energy-coupling factor transporter ATP-binding protein EcfA2
VRTETLRRRGPVTPVELAEAAVLADLALGLVVLGWLLPLGSALFAAACVPLVVLSVRQRTRVLVVGVAAAAALGFLVGGTGVDTNLLICAAVSAMVGVGIRHRWGPTRASIAAVVVVWPPFAAVTVALLVLFSGLRRLSLDQLRNFWNAIHHLLVRVGLPGAAHSGDRLVRSGLEHWWVLVPAFELVAIAVASRITYGLARRVVGRLAEAPPRVPLGGAPDIEPKREPGPVPVVFADVAFRYPGATTDALHVVRAEIATHQFVAVTGPNGAGKSTFVRLLAGAEPASGSVQRPGAVGLGREGGTAVVFQRPESQVLGVRVCDDVVWGLPVGSPESRVDVEAVLRSVGLAGLGDRDTITLSGGQLQRLAIAAALARRPALLVSDESTAMLDPAGRARLLTLLRGLPNSIDAGESGGPTVVHATHRVDEIDAADAVIAIGPQGEGRPGAPRAVPAPMAVRSHRYAAPSGPLVTLRGVGYTYSVGTPWARRALHGIDLTLGRADAVLVVGGNGSGKTTLAWLLAGLLTPTEGEARLEDHSIASQVGRVGLGFQHARLQLLRRTVAGELDGVGPGIGSVPDALELVGLPPQLATRAIDDLSGGQQRRVALARLLVSESPLLVLDEPLAGLDDEGRAELVAVLLRLRAERPFGLVIVSHDLVELTPVVDRVIALRNGEVAFDEASDPSGGVDAVSAFLAAEDA